jgi:hypothetical protein
MQVTLANDEANAAGDRNQGLSTNVSNTFLVGLGNASVEGSFAPLRCTALTSHTFTFEPPPRRKAGRGYEGAPPRSHSGQLDSGYGMWFGLS